MTSRALRIAYVGPVALPEGGAAARRMLGIAQSIRAAGHAVVFGSGQMPPGDRANPFSFEGFPVHSLAERTAEHLPILLKHLVYVGMGRRTRAWLARLDPPPDVVILYAGFAPYLLQLLPWCRRRRIPLVFDAVEWYEPSSMPGGRFGPYRWSFELSARDLCVRCGNVIAISSYLREYYRSRGCLTVRTPPTLDVAALPPLLPPAERDGVTIGFAGSPGAGNAFDTIVDAIVVLAEQGRRIRLRVAGATVQRVLRCPALASRGLTRPPDFLDVLGPLSHADALLLMRDADFTALVRPVRRYSTAAFPTKVVESLAVGTPVICNLTSDLGEHLVDGREALLCADPSRDGLIAAFDRALGLARDVHAQMRFAARATAEAAFDYRRFATPIGDFLERAVRRAQAA